MYYVFCNVECLKVTIICITLEMHFYNGAMIQNAATAIQLKIGFFFVSSITSGKFWKLSIQYSMTKLVSGGF